MRARRTRTRVTARAVTSPAWWLLGVGAGPGVVSVAPVTTPSSTPAQVPAALDSLRVELMELGGPNTLIWPAHDPDVLELTTAHPGGVAMLLAGHDARLSDLVREPSSLRRVQAMARRLTEHCDLIAEEHGVHTCFLAMGAASWPVSGEQERPLAPVLLRRCRLRRLRPGPDFALDFDDRVELNPALLTYLQRALRRTIDGDRLVGAATARPEAA